MESMAFVQPLKEGKFEEFKQWADELAGGRADDEHARRNDIGLNRLKIWLQHTPSEMAIIYIEAEDMGSALAKWYNHEHDHETWVQSRLDDLVDRHDTFAGGTPTQLVYDWHPTHGPSREEHKV